MASWGEILTTLVRRQNLSTTEVAWAMDQVLTGEATPVQIAGFVVALRSKGETVDELTALAQSMLDHATPISLDREAVDIVGSGGDRAHTVNVSTMAAIVAAAAGAKVVKHGNRAASSSCGTADVLQAMGVRLDVPPGAQAAILERTGIVFLFAPLYHQALRHAATARSELGIATVFNFLGPLANPARPIGQAVGVADERMAGLMAGVLAGRGNRGLVFHGSDGLDELTTTTTSRVWVIANGECKEDVLDPAALGMAPATREDLVGGDPAHNADVVRKLFRGDRGPVRDIVLLNAAAALLAYSGPDTQRPIGEQLAEQLVAVNEAIDSGKATELLADWADATNSVGG